MQKAYTIQQRIHGDSVWVTLGYYLTSNLARACAMLEYLRKEVSNSDYRLVECEYEITNIRPLKY